MQQYELPQVSEIPPSLEGLKAALSYYEELETRIDKMRREYEKHRLEIYTPPPPPEIPWELQDQLTLLDQELLPIIAEAEKYVTELKEQVRQKVPGILSSEIKSITGINWSIQRGATSAKFEVKPVLQAMDLARKSFMYKIIDMLNTGAYGTNQDNHPIPGSSFFMYRAFYDRESVKNTTADTLLKIIDCLENGYTPPTEYGKFVPIKR